MQTHGRRQQLYRFLFLSVTSSEYRYEFTFEGSVITELILKPLPPLDRYQTRSQIKPHSGWLRQNHPQQHQELFRSNSVNVELFEKTSRHRQLIGEWQSAN